MPSPSAEAARVASLYRIGLPNPATTGVAGERLGRGTGASLEFQDRRAYAPGDDLRRLDWRAYARTDQLLVKLHREEVLPRLELILDGSRSMAVAEEKARLAVDIASVLASSGRADGYRVAIVAASDRPESPEWDRFETEGIEFDATTPLGEVLAAAGGLLRAGSLRVLISDFLVPIDASSLVRPLAARAGSLLLVQVLAREDADPPEGVALRLTDAETGAPLDLVLDRRTVKAYRERLRRLSDSLEAECRRAAGRFVSLVADATLETICRDRLAPAGVLVPG